MCAAPTVNTLLVADPAAARLELPVQVCVGASPPSPTLFRRMEQLNLLPVHMYGMTETYGPITKRYPPRGLQRGGEEYYAAMTRQGHGILTAAVQRVVRVNVGGSRGQGEDGSERSLVDVRRDGQEVGEVVYRGNGVMRAYHRDRAATAAAFAGGHLHTGDLAVWHADGAIQLVDRMKDIIISGGENISTVALEAALAKHPAVLEVGVIGVRDEQWGERPRAYVTLRPGPGAAGWETVDATPAQEIL
ncbi:Acyl-CoA synthetase member 3, mitochondrial, partial [Ascosphaera acerosa]